MNTGRPERYTNQVTAGPGGAMTDEVGVITGDLTLTGSPAPVPPDGLHVLHTRVIEAVRHGAQAVVPGK
ncbi:hypothetical protein ACFXKG_12910 [Streptomyces sp. NPDC059255]|uniref:hypothetical protein n=1 Tax=Streptomyces sp. NPDC059255 TaxID=3346793 RepID=UPI0036C004F6